MRDSRRSRLLLSVALAVALVLITIDYQNGSAPMIRVARSAANSVFGTAERAVSGVTAPIVRLVGANASSGQNAVMERRLIALRAKLAAVSLSNARYRELSQLLRVTQAGGYRVVAATVVGYGQGYQQTVTLSAGSAEGVGPQQTVLDGNGLVGQVVSVTAHTCTVLLATDTSSTVGVRMAPSGQVGWVTGLGRGGSDSGLLKLTVLNPAVPLKAGEKLVTAASERDRPFVPGVPVGVVVTVLSRAGSLTAHALVRPYADFGALDVTGIVIRPPRHDPKYKVLPVAARSGH